MIEYGSLKNASYLPRCIDEQVDRALTVFGGVLIRGPKFCGKTWCGRSHANSEASLMPTEVNPSALEIISAAPALALKGDSPHLIDEWQELPVLWDMVRSAIDESGKSRSFILAGSSTPREDKPRHSGVGRIEKVNMRTMSLAESGESTCDVSLAGLFEGAPVLGTARCNSPNDLTYLITRGGWPAALHLPPSDARTIPASYIKSFIEEDMDRVDGIARDKGKMSRLLHSLARNTEQAATAKTSIRDMTEDGSNPPLAIETLTDYLGVLQRAFVLELIGPWSPNLRSPLRINKKPKYHFSDPSLPAAVLGATEESLLRDFETLGFLFECLCTRDLLVYAQAMNARVCYYRDRDDLEVDEIIEAPDGRWGAFEVKLGHNQADKAALNLLKLRAKIENAGGRPPVFLAVIEGLGDYAYTRPDGVHVIPIQTLCP